MREVGPLILPSVSTLTKLGSGMSQLSGGGIISYLKQVTAQASHREKIVSLIFDEINVKSAFTFSAGTVFGQASNSAAVQEANAVQGFMVKSIFGKLEEVIGLFPVSERAVSLLQ